MRNTAKIATSVLAAGALTLGLSACGTGSGSAKADANAPLKVAASQVPHAEILDYVKTHLAKKANLELEVQPFTDYVTPNTATQDGSVDANYFQNQPYLDDFNKKKGTTIVPVVTVHLEPLGLYSHKVKKADGLRSGATVAIPNDTVNEARALKLLDANGIIELKKGAGNEATPRDIAKNPKKLKFKELEAAQLPRSLDDVDASVINGNYAIDAKLKPAKDALVLESPKNNPYGNFLAVKKGNEKDPRVKKLAKLLTSPEVKKFIEDKYDGSVTASF
ncbi:MetQ/NlpA family ABC transporter substrate-binding protein [Streptomyces sp. bgisy100]|uniref:MetQ/NlpA family ABC transporter substrate-binding protein n=1 Tax=Streptomyces sp. bgisy100 TaxID=3413783 RepID=UPI003D711730